MTKREGATEFCVPGKLKEKKRHLVEGFRAALLPACSTQAPGACGRAFSLLETHWVTVALCTLAMGKAAASCRTFEVGV